jgi:hypothetical protein
MPPEVKPPWKSTELVAFGTIVYRPLATALLVRFGAVAMALSVVVELTETGPVYFTLEVVGVEPSVV